MPSTSTLTSTPSNRYPLFSPCKCSGSIGLVHQDCLASWLKVQRGDGRCELCSTKFRFAPQYAENAPEQLPLYEVFLGISRSAVAKWLPFVLRIGVALFLWLACVPLATAYCYWGWFHSPSSVAKRWQWDLVVSDTISGAVIAGIVIVSFLSLMSFADFLRFNPNQGGQPNRNNNENGAADLDVEVDDVVLDHNHIVRRQRNVNAVGVMDQRQPVMAANPHRQVRWIDEVEGPPRDMERLMEGIPDDPVAQREALQRRIRAAAQLQRQLDHMEEERNEEGGPPDEDEGPVPFGPEDEARIAQFLRDMQDDEEEEDANPRRDNFEPQFEPLNNQGVDQGINPDDMEVNLALDELLGLRGPLGAMIRNILWFMVFIVVYLGLFACLPRFVGKAFYRRLFVNSTIVPSFVQNSSYWNATEPGSYGMLQLVDELNAESHRLNRTLQLNDLTLLVLGYVALASVILCIQLSVTIRRRMRATDDVVVVVNQQNAGDGAQQEERDPQPAWENAEGFVNNEEGMENNMTVGQFFSQVLACALAFVKVGVLLFLKMLFLPLTLGIWLDAATLSAFDQSPSSRILHAGTDLFSSLLIHWVVGITFMLLVTVSVLQLREVIHPGLLARMIRPQEPQPDLLGNMMTESGLTHAKRMALSFGIYAFLLSIYVWLPAKLTLLCGLDAYVPLLRPKLWYLVTPQLQVPLELLLFHLTMLGFLEKYKNSIGGMQHRWLKTMCKLLGLVEYLLPREVTRFALVGWKPIFVEPDELGPDLLDDVSDCTPALTEITSATGALHAEEAKQNGIPNQDTAHQLRMVHVDSFWYELAGRSSGVDQFIEEGMIPVSRSSKTEAAFFKRNGKCTVNGCKEFIRLPLPAAEQDIADRRRRRPRGNVPPEGETKNLVPSTLGDYRLRRGVRDDGTMVIEFWKECLGDVVARPPEGWDDLGVGGAEVQGRWAWGKERKARVEESVGARKCFFGDGVPKARSAWLIAKILFLLLMSWAAVASLVIFAASAPMAAGRLGLQILRVPDKYIHDPVSFAIGLAILSSVLGAVSSLAGENSSLLGWARSVRFASTRRAGVVGYSLLMWCVAIPIIVGTTYDLLIVKSSDWFAGEVPFITAGDLLSDWGTGFVLLNFWAYMCVKSGFTLQFWANVGNVEFDGAGDVGPQADANAKGGTVCWQGTDNGRIHRFFEVLSAVFLRGEWDQVDPDILIRDCINPIALKVSQVLYFPCMIVGIWVLCLNGTELERVGVVVPQMGLVFEGLFRMYVFRGLCVIAIAVQSALAFREELKAWFQVVHKAARDDRYLIGEVLLNHGGAPGVTL